MRWWSLKIYWTFVKWFQPKYSVLYFEDLPPQIKSNIVYLIGEKHNPWQAAFVCPCGCKSIIQLSLVSDSNPRWKIHYNQGQVSIFPSIHRKVGCKSHFYLERSKIDWVDRSH